MGTLSRHPYIVVLGVDGSPYSPIKHQSTRAACSMQGYFPLSASEASLPFEVAVIITSTKEVRRTYTKTELRKYMGYLSHTQNVSCQIPAGRHKAFFLRADLFYPPDPLPALRV